MSKIANSVARLITLRDGIKDKLIDFGIINNESATLSDCKDAINGIDNSVLTAPTINISPSISINNSTGVVTASGSGSGTAKLSKGFCKGLSATASVNVSGSKGLTTQGAQTITPKTYNQTIAANRWLTGAQTIKGDANLIASNIRAGANIFGVQGSLESLAMWSGQRKISRRGLVYFDESPTTSGYTTYLGYVIDIYNIGFTPLFATAVGWGKDNQYLKSSYIYASLNNTHIAQGLCYCTDTKGASTSGTARLVGYYGNTTNGKNGMVLKFDSSQVSIPLWQAGEVLWQAGESEDTSLSAVFDVQIFGHY
jgi:hypothetical protein